MIDALAPMHFGARAFGPVYLAHTPDEPHIWLTTIDRTLLPRAFDVSRFMAGVGELLHVSVPGAVDVVLVDREADFCVVGHRADLQARTLAAIAESEPNERATAVLAATLARTLADLHARAMVHGLLTPSTIVRAGELWWTWQHGLSAWCVPERLAQRLRPPGGDPIAPEVRAGAGASPASDVFSWAAAVACLLTGAVGSEAITLLEIDGRDDPLRELVRSCLEPSPELRPANGAALLARLEVVLRMHALAKDDWEQDSGEVSFAELFEDLEPPSAAPVARVVRQREELVELLDLDDDSSAIEVLSPITTSDVEGAPTSVTETPSWREIAERYLAEEDQSPRRQVAPDAEEPPPALARTADDEGHAPGNSAADLARVSLVRARVRTGPSRAVRADPSATSGEWLMSVEPELEPDTPPRSDPDAPALPSGERVADTDWDDTPLYAFPDPETGEIIIAGPTWTPEPDAREHDTGRDPDGIGPDDTPRLVPLPKPPPLPELPPLGASPRRTAPTLPAIERERPPRASRPTGPVPAIRPLPSRLPTGNRFALALACVGAVAAVAMTIAAASDGGWSAVFVPAAERAEASTHVAAVADTLGDRSPTPKAPTCPDAMVAVDGVDPPVCIDRGEYPAVSEMPRTHVSLVEAARACNDRALRLCTPEEWRSACRGPGRELHPYGGMPDLERCNGASASGAARELEISGAREGCVTATGVFDLEGNVAEWVEGGAALGGDATTRGPSCESRAQPGADTRAPTLGFRCCRSSL